MNIQPTPLSVLPNQNSKAAFRVLTSLFFMWGFITVMNDVLNNTVAEIFDLDHSPVKRAFVQFTFFGAFFFVSLFYFIVSSTKGDPINRIGYNKGMIGSLVICAVGCFGFYPAAQIGSYGAFLSSLFVLGTGVTLLQICANPYAAIMGSPETASSRLNLAQGLNSLGTALAPVVGSMLIYRVFSDGSPTAQSISTSYLFFGSAFLLLAFIVAFFKLPAYRNTEIVQTGKDVLKFRHLKLGILAIFFYVGCEVSVGNWLVDFMASENVSDFLVQFGTKEKAKEFAGHYLSYFWGGLMIGRVLANFAFDNSSGLNRHLKMILSSVALFMVIYFVTSIHYADGQFTFDFISTNEVLIYVGMMALQFIAFQIGQKNPARSLVVFCCINFGLILTGMFASGPVAFWAMVGTGMFFSIGWSNIFTLAIRDLGKYTSQGSSLLVMAIVGGALMPLLQAFLYKNLGFGIQYSFIVPALGMIYLIYYGVEGYKIKTQL